ncbi:putative sodium:dicarboxylate symporter [Selenomonas ruminantium subsp. lactilytica TAM6421]|uniref:Putative sodium:dicarboxylate symporter n=1 Tax=Selenomonas ruminantium subsp. lactilytica (strain NBRC 103574 / TAM6421) TaxID=927704 RepID=I0GQ56_SELRL|nr:dicarboxylate/amino acid:cation symporter [Selenomonas ruminantium]BAL82893.1 putative sodium:dicarboxylate symporter [Selenomonas ruminantium subsp. lactilytica TAM6421]
MFERWRTFELTGETFRETIAAIGESLLKLGVSTKEAATARQLLEHIYSLQLSLRPEVHVKVSLQKHFGDISVRMETIGKAYNPLQVLTEWNEEDPDYQRTIVLKSKKEMLSYTHSNGKNIVTIKVHEAGNKQIRYTLFAMVMGILAGALIQEMLSPDFIAMLNKNIIGSIRTMFLNSLNMMIAPVVFFSIISGITSISNASDIGRIGGKLVGTYMCTTIIATTLSIIIGLFIFHGAVPQMGTVSGGGERMSISLLDMIVNVVPENLVAPIVNRDMLQIIFVSVLFGITINMLGEKAQLLKNFIETMNTFCLRVITLLAQFIPLIAFLSMMALMFTVGTDSLLLLGRVLVGQFIGAIAMLGIYATVMVLMGKISPLPFLKKIGSFVPVAISMGSSTAAMPFTMRFCTEKMGVSPKLSSFSIPLGATVNMDGGCFYFSIQAILLAKMYGLEMTPAFIGALFVTVVALSIGAPGVPGGSFVCLTSIIVSFGLPVEASAIVLGIDPLTSMFRTTINTIGDIAVTTALSKNENMLDEAAYMHTEQAA